MVSGTFQALQSYKLEDIVFGGRFEPCMSQNGGKIYVDVDKFHNILPPNENSLHRYSVYNGGYNHRMAPSLSYLPTFFRSTTEGRRLNNSDHNSNSSSPVPGRGSGRSTGRSGMLKKSSSKLASAFFSRSRKVGN